MKYLWVVLLTGCASIQPTINGYEDAIITNLKSAEDQHLKMLSVQWCATPLSAAIRHPEIIPSLKALCLPAGSESSPATLLDQIK